MAFFPLPALLLLFATFVSETEQVPPLATPPLLLQLTHTLSKTYSSQNTTAHTYPHHLLKSSSDRSAARFRSHRRHYGRLRRQVSLPLTPGSDYTLSFSIGSSPSRTVELYMDTGSDLVWLPCAPFECILCEGKPNYPPPPESLQFPGAAPVPCNSLSCSAAHSSLPSSDLCTIAGCPLETVETSSCSAFPCPLFYYAYGDGSLVARLRRDHLSIPAGAAKPLQLPNFTFGCAHTALAEPVGVAGFGRGPLSLPAQLTRVSPHLGNQFSYCLISHSFAAQRLHRPSPLILGRTSLESEPFIYTPMLDNPVHPYFYSVGLEAVSIGRRKLAAPPGLMKVDHKGNGGMVVDSGTTFTMLPAEMYSQISEEFNRLMIGSGYDRVVEIEKETGLGPCYDYDKKSSPLGVPSLVLRFAGNASVALPRRNYFLGFTRGGRKVGCLMVMNGGDVDDGEGSGGPAGTLGNFQQQGLEVVYDLAGRRVGFARRECAALWDALSRG